MTKKSSFLSFKMVSQHYSSFLHCMSLYRRLYGIECISKCVWMSYFLPGSTNLCILTLFYFFYSDFNYFFKFYNFPSFFFAFFLPSWTLCLRFQVPPTKGHPIRFSAVIVPFDRVNRNKSCGVFTFFPHPSTLCTWLRAASPNLLPGTSHSGLH